MRKERLEKGVNWGQNFNVIFLYLTFVKNNFIDVLVVIRYKKPNVEKGAFGVTYYQGMNHQNGKLMIDMCKHIDIPYTTVKGPKKRLKTHDDFIKRTGLTQFKQSNIEQRKAYMLIHNRE